MTALDSTDRALLDFLCAAVHHRCRVTKVKAPLKDSLQRLRNRGLVWFEGFVPSPSAMLDWNERMFPQSSPPPGGAVDEEPPAKAAARKGGAVARKPSAPPRRKRRGTRAYNAWTAAEMALLIEHYPKGGLPVVLPLLPNHSQPSIKGKIHSLGLRATASDKVKRAWTAEEDRLLAEVYPTRGVKGVQERLPHRSEQSIYNRVGHAGIERVGKRTRTKAPAKVEAPAPIEVETPRPCASAKQPLSFQEQLARVAAGAPIIEVSRLRPAGPDRTLGGVTGEIL